MAKVHCVRKVARSLDQDRQVNQHGEVSNGDLLS